DNLWSERWDRPGSDFFAIEEVSEKLANRLGGGAGLVQQFGRIAAHRKQPSNLTAYDYYLVGTEKLERVNVPDLIEAKKLLERAVELDPNMALAWVELFHAHNALASFDVDTDVNRKAAFDAAKRALELDPSDAEAHAVYAMSLAEGNDLVRAKAEFET